MEGTELESSEWYKNSIVIRLIGILILLGIDVIVNNLFEPPPSNSDSNAIPVVILFCVQLICVLVSLTLFYLIFTRTWFFQAGLFGTMITKFRSFVIVFVLNLIFLITVRFWRLYSVIQGKTFIEIWDMRAYYPLYIIYRLLTPIYYVSVIRACFNLCQYNLYNASQEDIRLALQNTTK